MGVSDIRSGPPFSFNIQPRSGGLFIGESEQFSDQIKNQGKYNTNNDHGSNWDINPEILPLNIEISR